MTMQPLPSRQRAVEMLQALHIDHRVDLLAAERKQVEELDRPAREVPEYLLGDLADLSFALLIAECRAQVRQRHLAVVDSTPYRTASRGCCRSRGPTTASAGPRSSVMTRNVTRPMSLIDPLLEAGADVSWPLILLVMCCAKRELSSISSLIDKRVAAAIWRNRRPSRAMSFSVVTIASAPARVAPHLLYGLCPRS